jgi:hypothetical protein
MDWAQLNFKSRLKAQGAVTVKCIIQASILIDKRRRAKSLRLTLDKSPVEKDN